ncbi:FMRFamide receptor-like [Patella vulgata]|uniref:FMRFamide receptor-like n=1 Tax=Patella vulgata TaxID=6465 RepID=UPI00218079DB|nr:FMRFamide receptor-like [Patella vulgata]
MATIFNDVIDNLWVNVSEVVSHSPVQLRVVNITHFQEYQIAEQIIHYISPVLSICGIIGNTLTLLVLVTSSFRKSVTCWYMTIIAVLDTIALIFQLVWYFIRPKVKPDLFTGRACAIMYAIFFFAIHYNVFLLVAMTIQRYIVVRFPLRAQKLVNKKRTIYVIVALGLLSLVINAHHLFTRKPITSLETGLIMCTADVNSETFIKFVWPLMDAILYGFAPLFCLTVFNVLIVRQLRHAGRRHREMVGSGSQKDSGCFTSSQAQVTLMLLLVSASFMVFVTPIALTVVIERYALRLTTPHDRATHYLVRVIASILMFTNHSLNFVLYCLSGRKFRAAIWAVFICSQSGNNNKFEITPLASVRKENSHILAQIVESISDEDNVSLPGNVTSEYPDNLQML